ncbi:hypothetical protein D3C79_764890 [compost metagenome]
MQHMNRPGRLFVLGQDHLQLPIGQFIRHLIRQQAGNPQPATGGGDRPVIAGHCQPRLHAHQGRLLAHPEAPAGSRRQVGSADHRMPGQVRGMLRHAMTRQVVGGCAQHAPYPAHPQCLQPGVGQRTDAYGHVHALLDHVHHTVEEVGGNIDVRVLLQVANDTGHDELLAEQDRGGNCQVAFGGGVDASGRLVGLVDAGQDVPGVLQVAAAGFGKAHAAGGAQQQLHAKLVLQGADGAGDGGRGNVQAARGGGEALQLTYRDEHLHQVDLVHAGSWVFGSAGIIGYPGALCCLPWPHRRQASSHLDRIEL